MVGTNAGSTANYALLRAPFGWDFIPYIANKTLHALLDKHASNGFGQFIYYDDHLGYQET